MIQYPRHRREPVLFWFDSWLDGSRSHPGLTHPKRADEWSTREFTNNYRLAANIEYYRGAPSRFVVVTWASTRGLPMSCHKPLHLLLIVVFSTTLTEVSAAQTFTILHSFSGGERRNLP
jgi:hypothetical protein